MFGGNNFDAKSAHVSLVVMRISAHEVCVTRATSKRRFPSVPILVGSLLMLGWAAHALEVDEIVTRHTEALGGKAKLAALQSLRLVGKISFGSGDFSIDLTWTALLKRPGMIREEASLQGLTGVSAYDGKEGWQVQPFQGRKEPEHSSPDDSKGLAQRADIEGPLVGWKEKGFSLAYLGSEDVDGTDALKLKLTRPSRDFEYVFLDPDYFLVIRSDKVVLLRADDQKIIGIEKDVLEVARGTRQLELKRVSAINVFRAKIGEREEIGRASCRERCRSRWSPYH